MPFEANWPMTVLEQICAVFPPHRKSSQRCYATAKSEKKSLQAASAASAASASRIKRTPSKSLAEFKLSHESNTVFGSLALRTLCSNFLNV